jgi:pimeloyl-ACP methyl ester carboxylesterase
MQTSRISAGEASPRGWRDLFFSARDGLRLHARHYPAPGTTHRPVLCLAGLTRNARDFHELALFLSDAEHPAPRDVYALDYRGRGRSAHDRDWRNYTLQIELLDVIDFMTIAGLSRAAVVGTSRGGLIAMLMAAMRPTSLGAVVLNDIGPIIEREGLARIVAYTGRVPLPVSWPEATKLLHDMNRRHFPAIADEEWDAVARQWFDDVNGRPAHAYDQNLAKAVQAIDGPAPELWPQFEALAGLPVLAVRGEKSDILAERTLEEMRQRHPRLETFVVPGQGHAPLLRDRPSLQAISAFLVAHDDRAASSH